jgi:hypothetical protein
MALEFQLMHCRVFLIDFARETLHDRVAINTVSAWGWQSYEKSSSLIMVQLPL